MFDEEGNRYLDCINNVAHGICDLVYLFDFKYFIFNLTHNFKHTFNHGSYVHLKRLS